MPTLYHNPEDFQPFSLSKPRAAAVANRNLTHELRVTAALLEFCRASLSFRKILIFKCMRAAQSFTRFSWMVDVFY